MNGVTNGRPRRRQRRLPAIVSRQVAAIPLRANVIDFANRPEPNGIHRIVVQHTVMLLEDDAEKCGANCQASHDRDASDGQHQQVL